MGRWRNLVRGKIDNAFSNLVKASQPSQEATPAAVADPVADAEKCAAFEEFTADVGSPFIPDLIEGCRVILTKTIDRDWGEVLLSECINLGTYPTSTPTQEDLVKALIEAQSGKQVGPKGGVTWSSLFRWTLPGSRASVLSRYASRSGAIETRVAFTLTRDLSLRATYVGSEPFNILKTVYGEFKSAREASTVASASTTGSTSVGGNGVQNSFFKLLHGGFDFRRKRGQDMIILAAERSTSQTNTCAKYSFLESPVYGVSHALRLHPRLTVGGDVTYLSSSGAIISTFGGRYRDEHNVAVASVSSQPNFELPMAEGLKQRLYSLKTTYGRKVSERLAVSAEIDVPVSKPKLSTGKLGCEYQFSQARIVSCIDTDLRVCATMEDATGVQISGDVDLLNHNFKFGYGFEISPSRFWGEGGDEDDAC